MPIAPTPSAEQAEASAAWLLFGETAKALRDGRDIPERDRLLENAYRGLQAYRPDGERLPGSFGLHRTTHDAVDAAFERTAPGVPRDRAVEALVDRMRAVVAGEGGADDEVEHLSRFFDCVREGLDRPVALS